MIMRLLCWTGFLMVLIALLVLAPNLLWLKRSSVMLHNASDQTLQVRLVLADDPDRLLDLGPIAAGVRRFYWIDPAAEATLEVDIHDGETWRRHCREYVEAATYRVEIIVKTPREVACITTIPLFQNLLLLDHLA